MEDTLAKQFRTGHPPMSLDGFYKGTLLLLLQATPLQRVARFLSAFAVPWKGKCFYHSKHVGDNILPLYMKFFLSLYPEKITLGKSEFGGFHAFTFKTEKTKGVNGKEVLRLDYDIPENPQRIRDVVDEIVEIGKKTYLGKAYLKENGSYRLVAYFKLQR
ncbi:MAG: hypothetical protein HYV40_04450 [Candidatus Levybacteria bacterium]|nr:hypothetical protein [Candidatus Levybacteria bacterium]